MTTLRTLKEIRKTTLCAMLLEQAGSSAALAKPAEKYASEVLSAAKTTAGEWLKEYGYENSGKAEYLKLIRDYAEINCRNSLWLSSAMSERIAEQIIGSLPEGAAIHCVGEAALHVVTALSVRGRSVEWSLEQNDPMLPVVAALLNLNAGPVSCCGVTHKGESLPLAFLAIPYEGQNDELSHRPAEYLWAARANKILVAAPGDILHQSTRSADEFRERLLNFYSPQRVDTFTKELRKHRCSTLALIECAVNQRLADGAEVEFVVHRKASAYEDTKACGNVPSTETIRATREQIVAHGGLMDAAFFACKAGEDPQFRLSDVAEVRRCLMVKHGSSGKEYFEIRLDDCDIMGVLSDQPRRKFRAAEGTPERRAAAATVKDGDILISLRGKTGTVALVEKPCDNTIGNQQFVIVRIRPNFEGRISPEYLFRYLRSERMTRLIGSRITGDTLPSIRIKDIENLPVEIPSSEKLAKVNRNFAAQRKLLAQLNDLRERISSLDDQDLFEQVA